MNVDLNTRIAPEMIRRFEEFQKSVKFYPSAQAAEDNDRFCSIPEPEDIDGPVLIYDGKYVVEIRATHSVLVQKATLEYATPDFGRSEWVNRDLTTIEALLFNHMLGEQP